MKLFACILAVMAVFLALVVVLLRSRSFASDKTSSDVSTANDQQLVESFDPIYSLTKAIDAWMHQAPGWMGSTGEKKYINGIFIKDSSRHSPWAIEFLLKSYELLRSRYI